MSKLLLATIFIVCSAAAAYAYGEQGYYKDGLYIPTHVTACVEFCHGRKGVRTLTTTGDPLALIECLCWDSRLLYIPPDPYKQNLEDYFEFLWVQ